MLTYVFWLIGVLLLLTSGVYAAKIISRDSSVLDFSTPQLTRNHKLLATTIAFAAIAFLMISGKTIISASGMMADISLGLYVITIVLGGAFIVGEIHDALDQKKR